MKGVIVFITLISLSKISFSQTEKTISPFENAIFVKVEIDPRYPGGDSAWKDYLQKNIDATIPAKNGLPKGSYTIMTMFIVHKDSTISDIRAENTIGHGMDAEAIRLIKNSGKWIPARQNGYQVNAYMRIPIIFKVE